MVFGVSGFGISVFGVWETEGALALEGPPQGLARGIVLLGKKPRKKLGFGKPKVLWPLKGPRGFRVQGSGFRVQGSGFMV